MRRLHEDFQGDPRAVPIEFVGHHPSHLHPPEKDRRPHVVRSEVLAAEDELVARHVPGDDRGHLEALELLPPFRGLADIQPDIGPGKQRPEPRDLAPCDPCPNDPEPGVLHEMGRSPLDHFHGHHDT